MLKFVHFKQLKTYLSKYLVEFLTVSESRWMTTTIFHDWFDKFIKKVKTKPILLVLDGHMTHLSLATVQLAKSENIILVKLLAHCTDVM